MCGIAGILDFGSRDREAVEGALSRMLARLRRRGPDDIGSVVLDTGRARVGLGHTRLAILDPSPAGRQPMKDPETGHYVVHNGEVYNFRELRSGLSGSWRSGTDTEVILRSYARSGREALAAFSGMFAFGIWDARARALFLARDRLGIKPLYFARRKECFLFASEVRAILASGLVPRELDPVALAEYLAYQSVPSPRTLVKGIEMLPPASWMVIDERGTTARGTYWNLLPADSNGVGGLSRAEGRGRLLELLEAAVASHMVSDVPVGAFLSGGIDSSMVVALMAETGERPRTFSVVFDEEGYDESAGARSVAEAFDAEHHEIRLSQKDLLEQLPEALAAMDQPTGDGINTYVVSRAVRDAGIKVVQSGLGGDELFGGYPSFARLDRWGAGLGVLAKTPAPARSLLAGVIDTLAPDSRGAIKTAELLRTGGGAESVVIASRQLLSAREREQILSPRSRALVEGRADPYSALLAAARAASRHLGRMSLVSYGEIRTYLHDVLLRDTDQMSMWHGLEVRVPFLDHRLVELVMALPDAHKRPRGMPKRLLVDALNGRLPREVVQKKKRGFTLPFDPWMRGALRSFCEDRLSVDRLGARGLFEPEAVRRLWTAFLERRRGVSWSRVWILVVLEEWLANNGVFGSETSA